MIINPNLSNEGYRKMALLILAATNLGMHVATDSSISVDETGVHLYTLRYPFTLFIAVTNDEVQVYTHSNNNVIPVNKMDLFDIHHWAEFQ